MDHMLYVAMSGARQTMDALATVSHNLANASTTGFRADLSAFRSMPVYGDTTPTRVYAMAERPGFDLSPGALVSTGRDLDVAVQGTGWIAVQAADGGEAYTRAGDLRIDETGVLSNGAGYPILGDGGPITVPPAEKIEIAADGTLSAKLQAGTDFVVIDRIRLVSATPEQLSKGSDGLFRVAGGQPAADAGVTLATGAVEMSNVNTVAALVALIDLSRQYEAQVKLMQAAQDNDQSSSAIMRMT